MRIFAVGLIFLNLLYTCHGVVNIDEETRQLIDEFVRSVIFDCRRHDIVSMNLAVVHRGEVAYTTAYGVKDLGKISSLSVAKSDGFDFVVRFELTPS